MFETDATTPSWTTYKGVTQTSDGRTITCFARTAYIGDASGNNLLTGKRLSRSLLQNAGAPTTLRTTPGAVAIPTLDLTQEVQLIWALSADGDDL